MFQDSSCTIINITDENSSIDYFQNSLDLGLIVGSASVSILLEFGVICAFVRGLKRCKSTNIYVSASVFFWVLVTAGIELHRRQYFWEITHHAVADRVCRILPFLALATQTFAVLVILKLAWTKYRFDNRSEKDGNCWEQVSGTFIILAGVISIGCGAVASVKSTHECIIYKHLETETYEESRLCTFDSQETRLRIEITRLAGFVGIPFAVMLTLIVLLHCKIRRLKHKGDHYEMVPSSKGVRGMDENEVTKARKSKIFLVWTTILFVVCWLPIHAVIVANTHWIITKNFHLSTDQNDEYQSLSCSPEEENCDETNKRADWKIIFDQLRLYFFVLWLLFPAFHAFVRLILSKRMRRSFNCCC